jgi:amino acid permease
VLCGVGILSTPYAIKEGGWLGLVILGVFAVLAWYTGVLLRRCLDSTDGLQTYPDIGHAAFGTTGRIAISVEYPPSHIYLFRHISINKCWSANLFFYLVCVFTFLQIILYVELYVSTH